MRNHPLYQKLKQIAIDRNYTLEQVQFLSFAQATTLLGERPASTTFLENMKQDIIMELWDRDDEANLQQVRQKIKTWLDANFPNWADEWDREGGKPCIKLWLKGKP
ncbi:MAG: hypothetical protein OEW48_00065 [Phycisphaerae bacterium]|nr:hypothetical protein [Phycisphaerae bacterium]